MKVWPNPNLFVKVKGSSSTSTVGNEDRGLINRSSAVLTAEFQIFVRFAMFSFEEW